MSSGVAHSSFRLGVVVLAHNQPEQLAALLAALSHPRVNLYLHLDSRSAAGPFEQAFATAGVDGVRWLSRRRTAWGRIETVDVELEAMARALDDGCSYLITISGSDFPLRPIAEIVEFFEANRERSYVNNFTLPHHGWEFGGRERTDFYSYRILSRMFTCIPFGEDGSRLTRKGRVLNAALRLRTALKPPRRFPAYLTPHGGEHWMNLTDAAMRYVLEFVRSNPDYRRYHLATGCVDEIFIQSILLGSDFTKTHEIVNDDLRFLIWTGGLSDPHPKTLTLDDLPALRESPDLFARKVSRDQEPELFIALQRQIGVSS